MLVEHKADICAKFEERHMKTFLNISESLTCFILIAVMLEKPIFHRYDVEKGSRTEIALFARMGNFLAAVCQKLSKGRSAKLSFGA